MSLFLEGESGPPTMAYTMSPMLPSPHPLCILIIATPQHCTTNQSIMDAVGALGTLRALMDGTKTQTKGPG